MTEDFPSFPLFYAATHRGRTPFPWQKRLSELVAAQGWPDQIGVPTGLGKTACVDIAVWALAAQAGRSLGERTAATRTWYVVNRRLLVDDAYAHGQKLSGWLDQPRSLMDDWPDATPDDIAVLTKVGDALQGLAQLGSEHGPLHVTHLRGGAGLGARSPDPSQPALIFATVPMFASRWLFRGFGSSASMRPVDAALAGIDSLVLLDEAHLARPLAALGAAGGPLQQCDPGDPTLVLPGSRSRPRLVALTATGDALGHRFDLDEDDYAHEEIRKRIFSVKRTELKPSTDRSLVADLADATLAKLGTGAEPTTCVTFVNTPAAAREVFGRLHRRDDIECHLLTGRMREQEAGRVRHALLDGPSSVRSGAPRGERERHLAVVATQTLEVGADVDFDHLVTETAGVRALVQRFGRLNRLGRLTADPVATATIVHPEDAKEGKLYGAEPAAVWERLQAALAEDPSLGPARVAAVLGEPADAPDTAGQLLPHHLWDWVKTSVPRRSLAEPELFYDGIDTQVRVSVLWRAYLPELPEPDPGEPDAGDAVTSYAERRLVPPIRGDEAVDLPIGELRAALKARKIDRVDRLASDGATLSLIDVEEQLRPGDQIVLGWKAGFYDDFGWAPQERRPVPDRSLLRAGLPLSADVLPALLDDAALADPDLVEDPALQARFGSRQVTSAWADLLLLVKDLHSKPASEPRPDGGTDEPALLVDSVAKQLERLATNLTLWTPSLHLAADEPDWSDWRAALAGEIAKLLRNRPTEFPRLPDGTPFIALPKPRANRASAGVRSDAFDDLSFVDLDASSRELDQHLGTVAKAALGIAAHLHLPRELQDAVRQAAASHDLGKLDPRFQRWLDPDGLSLGVCLAKSDTPWYRQEAARARSGWPRGGRHELLSARVLEQAGVDDDLVLHLVLAHHGHGRPMVPVVVEDEPTKFFAPVEGVDGDVAVVANLSEPDWAQPARFRRLCERYGYWGLALLEAVVRQADHAASSQPGRGVAPVEVA